MNIPEIDIEPLKEKAGAMAAKVRPHISVLGRIQIRTGVVQACAGVTEIVNAILSDLERAPHSRELEETYRLVLFVRENFQGELERLFLSMIEPPAADGAQAETASAASDKVL